MASPGKFILAAFVLSFLQTIAIAQGTLTYSIKVSDVHGAPLTNTPVTLIESSSKERISKTTNDQGRVTFVLNSGKEWGINILQIKNYRYIKVPASGSGEGVADITYDYKSWERKNRPLVDRSKLKIEVISQKGLTERDYSDTEAIAKVTVMRVDNTPLVNFPIAITSYKLQKSFTTKTNSNGVALFKVPVKNEYDIDIDGINAFNFIDIEGPGITSLKMIYQPSDLTESVINDTITQKFGKQTTGTSGRTYAKFSIRCNDCDKIENEFLFLQEIGTTRVYKAPLNSSGQTELLLPIKRKYMISFPYEREVDVVDLSQMKGISEYSKTVLYRPDPELKYPDRYLRSPEKLLAQSFQEFLQKQYPDPAAGDNVGLFLKWGNPEINKNSKEALLEIGFRAPEQKPDPSSPPVNVCFVIDKSGSMEGDRKIECVRTAMVKYMKMLRRKDYVSLVAFDDQAYLLVPSQAKGDGTYMKDMIEDLRADGGTNIYSGLEVGYEQVQKTFIPKGTNRVVLLTDGYDGVPVDSTVGLSKRYSKKGIELSAIGVGEGYNYPLLFNLASVGGGLLQLSKDSEDMDKIFAKELSSLLTAIASDVEVEIEYNNRIVFKELYGFPVNAQKAGLTTMKLDNIYGGLNTLAFVKFELKNSTEEITKHPVTVRMKYFDVKKKTQVLLSEEASLKWSEATGELELVLERESKKLYALAVVNQFVKAMSDKFAAKDFSSLKQLTDDCLRQLKNLYPQADDADLLALGKRLDEYSLLVGRAVKAAGNR